MNEGNEFNPGTPQEPQDPQYGQQPEPQYAPPQDPQYVQPQEPQYAPPQEPQYVQPQEPQYPQPQYEQAPYEEQPQFQGGEAAVAKKSKAPIIIIAVIIVALIAVACIMLFNRSGGSSGSIDGISYSKNPQEYLAASSKKTSENIFGVNAEGEPVPPAVKSGFPAMDRFNDKPAEISMGVSIQDVDGYSEMAGANAELIFRADPNPEDTKLLMELSFGYGGLNLKGNQLFFSKDLLALSIPDLYTRSKYISVNPSTFVDDWNSSELGYHSPIDLDALGLGGLLDGNYFNTAEVEKQAEEMEKAFNDLAQELNSKAAFADEGEETITVNGKEIKAAKMSYTVSPEDMKEAFLSISNMMRSYMEWYFENFAQGYPMAGGYNPYADMAEQMDDMFAEINTLAFPEGAKYYYYVNLDTGLLCRMSVADMKVVPADYPDDYVSISFDMDMTGEAVLTDDLLLNISVKDYYEDEYRITVKNLLTRGNKPSWEMAISGSEYDEEVFTMNLNASWDPSAAADNFKAGFDMYDGWTDIGLNVRGNLTDSSDGFTLQDGVLDVSEDGESIATFGVSFGMKTITAADVAIDESQAVDFFTLDLEQLTQDLYANLMQLAMMM